MAVDLFSEASPRYSFSHDINQASLVTARSDPSLLDTGFDFEFGISDESFDQESSSADELFSQGILLPIQIREKGNNPARKQPLPTADQPIAEFTSKSAVEAKEEAAPSAYLEPQEKPQSKPSFWSFKRSSSLSCDGESKKSLLCSLQGLSRSNSTGSVPNPKKPILQNKDKAINPSKHPPLPKSLSTSSSSSSSNSSFYQKAPHPKGYYGGSSSYGPGGSRLSSVLNVPPPYISNANLFGLGSLFRNGKDKKPKK